MNFEGGKLVASPCLQPFQKQSFIAWNLPGSLDLVLAMKSLASLLRQAQSVSWPAM
jgi:hypothetical protein